MAEAMVGGHRCVLVHEVSDNTSAGFPREITMAVVFSEKNGGPVEGHQINFFFDGGLTSFHEAETNEHGRAAVTFPATKGGQKMAAVVDGTALSVMYSVPVEKAAPKGAVKDFDARTVMVDEEQGLVRISVRVVPAQKTPYRIEGGGVVYNGETDENGFGLFPPVSDPPLRHDKKIKYVVELPGQKRQEELLLEAPPLHPMPPPPPDEYMSFSQPVGLSLVAGFWWQVGSFLCRMWWRLRRNNNWRLLFAWIIWFCWLFANVYFFGVGIGGDDGSAEWLKYQNMSDAEKFFYESWHRRDRIPLPLEPGAVDAFWNWLRSWSWWLWVWWFVGSIVYIPIAFWDELSRAWYKARKTVLERREGVSRGGEETAGPVVPAGAEVPVVGERRHGRRSFFTETVMETLHEIVAEVAVHGISRRFR